MLMKAWIHPRRHFTSEVCTRAIPTSTIRGCYPMLIRQRECHSYYRDVHYYVIIWADRCLLIGWLWCLSTRRKMNMFNFCRSRIKAESKSNRNCNSHFRVKKWSAHSSKYRRFGDTASNIVPNCYIAIHNWVTIKMANESHHTTDNIRLMIRKIKHMWIQPSPSWRVHRISSWLQSTASIYQRCPAQ